MNLRDLKYLIALIDHEHFGKAAENCFVSQPALSMQIKKLEQTLGIQLIERTNKSFLLTEHGKIIAEHARQVLSRVETMREFAKLAKDPFSGELHLGIIPTLAPYLLPHVISGLTKAFPKLTIYLIEDKTSNLLTHLKQGKIDAALVALPVVDESFSALPIFEEEFLLAVPKAHTLSKQKKVSPSDLNNTSLLLLEEGHCLRDQALAFCQRSTNQASYNFKATSLETLRHMVAANVGITLLPILSMQKNDGISYLPFSGIKPSRTIGLIWRPGSAKKPLLQKVVQQARQLMTKQKKVKVLRTQILCGKEN